jgi:CRISPR-associated endonuclease/helicase Cas3
MFLTFWGKAQPVEGSAATWHPAAFHGLDVAAVAQVWLEAHPDAGAPSARAGGWDTTAWRRAVPFLVALHDAGKFSRAFQAKAPDHWPAALGDADAAADPGHDTTGFALLADPDTAPAALDRVCGSWEPWRRDPLLRAVAGHHGRPPAEDATIHGLPRRVACRACRAALADYAEAAAAALDPPALPPPPTEAGAAVAGWWLAHLTALADWVGSAQAWFPYVAPRAGCGLASYWHRHALPRARRAVAEAGLLPAAPAPAGGGLAALVPGATPTPSQRLAAELPLPDGPSLVLVEDATGSGKTEAALVLAPRLIAGGAAEGVFLALPTMATADAMFGRVAAAYRRLYAPDAAPSLALAHGRAELNPLFRGAVLAGAAREERATGDAADQPASAQCAAWLAEGRRRAFLAYVGVGTLDQALLAVLPARHAPLRLGGLARKVLVVDEAHAYDAYVGEELARLLRFHAALGGSAVVLSATLPRAKRAALVDAFRQGLRAPPAPLTSAAYPLVAVAGAAGAAEEPCAMRDGLARRLPVRRFGTAEEAAREIAAAAARGAPASPGCATPWPTRWPGRRCCARRGATRCCSTPASPWATGWTGRRR